MRKKIGVLLFGAMLACIPFLGNAQLKVGDRVFITVGPVAGNASSDAYPAGTYYFEIVNGEFGVHPSNDRDFNLENVAKEVLFDSGSYDVSELVEGNTWLNAIEVPFDAGISVLLGAGAVAAMKRRRNRQKEVVVA